MDPRKYDILLCTSSVEIGVTFRSSLMFIEPGYRLASFMQRVGRVSRGTEDGQVIVSLPAAQRNRRAWTRTIVDTVEAHQELEVQTFTDKILRDVRRRLEPTRKEVETDPETEKSPVSFYRRASWRGVYWAALFIVAIRREKMTIQQEAKARLLQISPPLVRFVEAKIGEILRVETVHNYLPQSHQPHKLWVDALLKSALVYRDIGATIEVVDPTGVRHTVSESFLRRATNILRSKICSDEDGKRVVRLESRTLVEEVEVFDGRPGIQQMTLYVRSPVGQENFTLSILEMEKGTEQLRVRLVEEWKSRFAPAHGADHNDPHEKVLASATALVEKLGWAPLDEDYEDSEESALFA